MSKRKSSTKCNHTFQDRIFNTACECEECKCGLIVYVCKLHRPALGDGIIW